MVLMSVEATCGTGEGLAVALTVATCDAYWQCVEYTIGICESTVAACDICESPVPPMGVLRLSKALIKEWIPVAIPGVVWLLPLS